MNIYFCQAGYRDEQVSSWESDPPEPVWIQAFIYANWHNTARSMFTREFDLDYRHDCQIIKIGETPCVMTTVLLDLPSDNPLWKLVDWDVVEAWEHHYDRIGS